MEAVQRRGSLQVAPASAQASFRWVSSGVVSCVSACFTGNGSADEDLEEAKLGIELCNGSLASHTKLLVVLLV